MLQTLQGYNYLLFLGNYTFLLMFSEGSKKGTCTRCWLSTLYLLCVQEFTPVLSDIFLKDLRTLKIF